MRTQAPQRARYGRQGLCRGERRPVQLEDRRTQPIEQLLELLPAGRVARIVLAQARERSLGVLVDLERLPVRKCVGERLVRRRVSQPVTLELRAETGVDLPAPERVLVRGIQVVDEARQ